MPDTFPLTDAAINLAKIIEGEPPTYGRIYKAILNGRLPCERINGRYSLRYADLPEIAAKLGLTVRVAA